MDGKDMACVPAVRQLFYLAGVDLNKPEWQILFCITLSYVLWKCFVCPQNVNLPIDTGIYEWE